MIQDKIEIGEKIKVKTMRGREDQIISRLDDGRVILFAATSGHSSQLKPDQDVEGIIVSIKENYIIIDPVIPEEPEIEEIEEIEYEDEAELESVIKDLKKMMKKASGNASLVPKALLQIINHQRFIVQLLKDLRDQ